VKRSSTDPFIEKKRVKDFAGPCDCIRRLG